MHLLDALRRSEKRMWSQTCGAMDRKMRCCLFRGSIVSCCGFRVIMWQVVSHAFVFHIPCFLEDRNGIHRVLFSTRVIDSGSDEFVPQDFQ